MKRRINFNELKEYQDQFVAVLQRGDRELEIWNFKDGERAQNNVDFWRNKTGEYTTWCGFYDNIDEALKDYPEAIIHSESAKRNRRTNEEIKNDKVVDIVSTIIDFTINNNMKRQENVIKLTLLVNKLIGDGKNE